MRGPGTFPWTDEQVAELKRLFADGHSASVIAVTMDPTGVLTRSAVIGKIHRLKLPGIVKVGERGGKDKPPAPRNKTRRGKQKTRVAQMPKFIPELIPLEDALGYSPPAAQLRTLMQLEEFHCRWICGEVSGADTLYCGGERVAEGYPYCPQHSAIAYRPRESTRTPWVARRSEAA